MGAKYLPSIKDLKAAQRFHQQQKQVSKPIASPKPVAAPSGKPAKRSSGS